MVIRYICAHETDLGGRAGIVAISHDDDDEFRVVYSFENCCDTIARTTKTALFKSFGGNHNVLTRDGAL